MRHEPLLAKLDSLRKDLDEDTTDIEWLALQHAFLFVSYNVGAFQKYVQEAAKRGEFDAFDQANG